MGDSTTHHPTPLSSPPPWAIESYTDADVQELGTFLCELLAQGHYRWHEPAQKAALKEALRICFPPLTTDPETCDAQDTRIELTRRRAGSDGSMNLETSLAEAAFSNPDHFSASAASKKSPVV